VLRRTAGYVVDGDIEILDFGEGLHAQLGIVNGPDAAS
jgi:hypothetical protein